MVFLIEHFFFFFFLVEKLEESIKGISRLCCNRNKSGGENDSLGIKEIVLTNFGYIISLVSVKCEFKKSFSCNISVEKSEKFVKASYLLDYFSVNENDWITICGV